MSNKYNSQDSNPQTYCTFDCSCQTCKKQAQILQMLDKKNYLQWFGKKKSYQYSHSLSTINKTSPLNQKIILEKNNNKYKKNLQSEGNCNKKHINLNSSYLQNYNNNLGRKADLCTPKHQISLQQPFEKIKSIYSDSYKKYSSYSPDKAKFYQYQIIKPSQAQFNLPFLGKSSYKHDYLELKKSKSNIICPKNHINTDKTTNLMFKMYEKNKLNTISQRPISPIIQKDSIVQSKALPSNYETNYKIQFQRNKKKSQFNLISQKNKQQFKNHHQDFLRRSKFGSLSKNRWIRQKSKQHSLNLYL